jgi:hypothetical protein
MAAVGRYDMSTPFSFQLSADHSYSLYIVSRHGQNVKTESVNISLKVKSPPLAKYQKLCYTEASRSVGTLVMDRKEGYP